ncbi:hypothetical protein PSECIP111854_02056 [Pseudoalteromonas sp. CIP111854]|uniref:Uncharacterized protein n=1 Tax=Pseudoalteromonas holothuriae TaxID=2963714 RepID=A0A9W4W3X6_9GAMM|nr:hypothetical protein [Pseudoalteromonas sp. CIP111854]CAH9057727.1 hypothetical protein PSECIP111854_02056 [Pseudoalteromonas sp. CIP111854]
MSIDLELAKITKIVSEQTDASNNLKTAIEDSWQEVEKVHDLAKHNHQAVHDWQTKTGQVTLKDLDNKAYQVDTLATLINETQKINPHPEVMSKAQFDALRQMRKQQYAGSGFVEWGKHINTPQYQSVNEGMWTWLNRTNSISLGVADSDIGGIGVSPSNRSKVLVDGVFLALSKVAHRDYVLPILPPAPDGTKTYDSATGRVTQHANAIEAFNECNTRAPNGSAVGVYDIEAGIYSFNGTSAGGFVYSNKAASGSHQVEIVFSSSTDTFVEFRDSSAANGSDPLIKLIQVSANTKDTIKFTHNFANGGVYLRVPTPVAGQQITIHSWQTLPSTEQVITSRKDLVFLESWHEKIADKDVVYPLGNVQFGKDNYEGMSLANNLVAQGYSAFGGWDTDTKGYGVKWSTLSAVNRVKFLKNPEHNIYYDPEAKAYIQVRYRIRVTEGCGDDWVESITPTNNNYFRYNKYHQSGYISPQGVGTIAKDFNLSYPVFTSANRSDAALKHDDYLYGAAVSRNKPAEVIAFEGLCFAIPIALVQRLNQGAYHPTYNPMGCRRFLKSGLGHEPWYKKAAEDIKTALQCFDIGEATDYSRVSGGSGFIGSPASSGRPDQYKYYDAIYAGQVEDLRLNANKLDKSQLLQESMQKIMEGKIRGREAPWFTQILPVTISDGSRSYARVRLSAEDYDKIASLMGLPGNTVSVDPHRYNYSVMLVNPNTGKMALTTHISKTYGGMYVPYKQGVSNGISDDLMIADIEQDIDFVREQKANLSGRSQLIMDGSTSTIETSSFGSAGDTIYLLVSRRLSASFDAIPQADIVGHPEKILEAFPDGVCGKWIPALPDGETQTYFFNRKMRSNKPTLWGSTTNAGVNWTFVDDMPSGMDAIQNARSHNKPANSVYLYFYDALSSFTQSDTNRAVTSFGNVLVTQDRHVSHGNRLNESLTENIGRSDRSHNRQSQLVLQEQGRVNDGGKIDLTYYSAPKHAEINFSATKNDTRALKSMVTLIDKDGLLYAQFHGCELQYVKQDVTDISESSTEPRGNYSVYRITDGPLKGRLLKRLEGSSTNVPFNDVDWSIDEKGIKYRSNTNHSFIFFKESFNWGDDQTIPIVNGEDVKTDLNGNTVKVFCHHTLLPLGIASH